MLGESISGVGPRVKRYTGYDNSRLGLLAQHGKKSFQLRELSDLTRSPIRVTNGSESAGALVNGQFFPLSPDEIVNFHKLTDSAKEKGYQVIIGRMPDIPAVGVLELVLTAETDPRLSYLSPNRRGPRRKCRSIPLTNTDAIRHFGKDYQKFVKSRRLKLPREFRTWTETYGKVRFIDLPIKVGVVLHNGESGSVWHHYAMTPLGTVFTGFQY